MKVDTLFILAVINQRMTDTVTPQREYDSKGGMGLFGWVIAVLIGLLFLPVLPFILLVVAVMRLFGAGEQPR